MVVVTMATLLLTMAFTVLMAVFVLMTTLLPVDGTVVTGEG